MHAVTALSVLALAGSALAFPAPLQQRDPKIVYETKVVTVIVTPGVPQHQYTKHHRPRPSSTPAPAPVVPTTTVVVQAPPPSSAPVEAPSSVVEAPAPPPSSAAPAPAPVETEAPSTGEPSYMSVVSEWRAKLGKPALKYSAKLEANALKTVQDGNGEMKHELNPGSYGQVLAPGTADGFEHVFVGGWLCERPDMPGMDGICATQSEGWAYGGQTGHADILTSTDYTQIGCALAVGIWGCDLAF